MWTCCRSSLAVVVPTKQVLPEYTPRNLVPNFSGKSKDGTYIKNSVYVHYRQCLRAKLWRDYMHHIRGYHSAGNTHTPLQKTKTVSKRRPVETPPKMPPLTYIADTTCSKYKCSLLTYKYERKRATVRVRMPLADKKNINASGLRYTRRCL